MIDTANGWIERLGLQPLEPEGGYYREVFRSDETLEKLPFRYAGARSIFTSIYYLLTPDSVSLIHRLISDEIFAFIAGDTVEMVQLYETGVGRVVKLGNGGAQDEEPQVIVPRRVWQGAKLADGGRFALLAVFVAPGFDPLDFELGKREELTATYPSFRERIETLTEAPDGDSA